MGSTDDDFKMVSRGCLHFLLKELTALIDDPQVLKPTFVIYTNFPQHVSLKKKYTLNQSVCFKE